MAGDSDREMVLANFQELSEAPIPDASWVADQLSAGTSTSSVSVGEVVGNAIPLQPSSRRITVLIEWRERIFPIVLNETETLGHYS